MTNIKFERNRKTPSDQDILKKKDFDSVLKQYNSGVEPTKWLNSAKLWGGIIATACLAGLGIFFMMETADTENSENSVKQEKTEITQEQFDQELRASYESNQEYFSFDPGKDTLLITSNGSVINIPAYAFDTECKKVKLVVNEIDDPVKMFQSKIDMGYDSAGTKYHFESAGMIEIDAFDDQQKINLAPGKEVSIALVTSSIEPTYNLYEKTKGNWDYLGDANTIFQPEKISETSEINENIVENNQLAVVNQEKVKVGKVNPSFPTFDVDISGNEELKAYKGIVFQVDPSEDDFLEDYYLVAWEKIKLEKVEKNYFIHLTRGNSKHRFKVNPVLNQKDYAQYLKNNKSKSSYYDQMSQKKKEYQQKFVDQNFMFNYDQADASYTVSSLINEEVQYRINNKNRRIFNVRSLGTINCDHILPEDLKEKVALAQFNVKHDGENLVPDLTYVVIPGVNTLFTFKGDGAKYYAKNGETKTWVVEKGRIGIVQEKSERNFETVAFYNAKTGVSKIEEYCKN